MSALKQINTVRGTLYGLDEAGALWKLVDEPTGTHWIRVPAPS